MPASAIPGSFTTVTVTDVDGSTLSIGAYVREIGGEQSNSPIETTTLGDGTQRATTHTIQGVITSNRDLTCNLTDPLWDWAARMNGNNNGTILTITYGADTTPTSGATEWQGTMLLYSVTKPITPQEGQTLNLSFMPLAATTAIAPTYQRR